MGGDGGGIGGPGGDVGSMGSGGYGSGVPGFGSGLSSADSSAAALAAGIASGGYGFGEAGYGGDSPGYGGASFGGAGYSGTPSGGMLGTPYPMPLQPSAPTWGSGGTASFKYPTPQEVHDQIYGLPYMQNQTRILGNMESMPAFRAAVMPEIQGVMRGLGRSGLPSSSYADRVITDTMGSLYNKWMWNVLTGYQNMGAQIPTMMNQWYQPYDKMLAYVGA